MKRLGLFILIPILLLAGCMSTPVKRTSVNTIVPIFDDFLTAAFEGNNYEVTKNGIPTLLILLEGMIEISPDNPELLTKACMVYAFYALAFMAEEDPEQANILYARSRDLGLKALLQKRAFRKKLNLEEGKAPEEALRAVKNDVFEEALLVFDKDDVPPLFWAAFGWGAWVELNLHDPMAFLGVNKVFAMGRRVVELDEEFFHGGGHLLLGYLYAVLPTLAGGGPDKAEPEFQKAYEISENNLLLFHVLHAQKLATLLVDEEMFMKDINYVLETPAEVLPELRMGNVVAKHKAQWLLKNKKRYF